MLARDFNFAAANIAYEGARYDAKPMITPHGDDWVVLKYRMSVFKGKPYLGNF
jgi:hypothetical protein